MALKEAEEAFERGELDRAAALSQGLVGPEAAHLRGLIAHRRGDHSAAEAHILAALAQRDEPLWRANLGIVLLDAGESERAAAQLRQSLAGDPGQADAHSNLSAALLDLGALQPALESAATALSLEPSMPEAYNNFGAALQLQGRLEDSRAAFHAARDLSLDEPEYRFNLGVLDLLEGHTERGWARYESRRPPRRPPQRWSGEPLGGAPLLLYAEQGLGDTLQFCRYAPLLAERGERIWLEVPSVLRPLLGSLSGIRLVTFAEGASAHRSLPLLSLPHVLGQREGDYPAQIPYLRAEPDRRALWRHRLPRGALRVGLCWQGDPTSRADMGRSFPLAQLVAHLHGIEGLTLISLQRGAGENQLGDVPVVHRLPRLDTDPGAFRDTAAVIESLDLVISADTAVAHLAGALGARVWVVLRHIPDWRWQLGREDSPWYPTARLLRQSTHGDWDAPFREIRAALEQELNVFRN